MPFIHWQVLDMDAQVMMWRFTRYKSVSFFFFYFSGSVQLKQNQNLLRQNSGNSMTILPFQQRILTSA